MIFIEKNYSKKVRKKIETFIQVVDNEGKTPHYKNLPKDDGILQEALITEQGYICAYCMQRIEFVHKIEHWNGQAENPIETLNYHNMLAVCSGKMRDIHVTHCDTKRGEYQTIGGGNLTINPLDRQIMAGVRYLKNGIIYHNNAEINKDFDETLNLNHLRFVDNRKQQYEEVLKAIALKCKGKTPEIARKIIKTIVGEWKKMHLDANDQKYKYKPYCGIIIYQFDR